MYKGLIQSYLQLIWDPQKNVIYEDCASNAYGPNKEFIPLLDDVSFNLYPDSDITLIVHADWWADNMREPGISAQFRFLAHDLRARNR